MNYFSKYIECKSDYFVLRKNMFGGDNRQKDKFIFLHFTKNYDSLIDILKDGTLKAGKYLKNEQLFMSGDTKSKYIYMSIYFDNIKNLTHGMDYTLIFRPEIYYNNKKEIRFNKGWGFKKMDLTENRNDNIKIIKKYLQELDELPEKIKEFSPLLHHEILFEGKIRLRGNLIGIICNNCSKEKLIEINNTLKNRKLNNVKVFDNNIIPDYDMII